MYGPGDIAQHGLIILALLPFHRFSFAGRNRLPASPADESRHRYQHDDKRNADYLIYLLASFEIFNCLGADFDTAQSSGRHEKAELDVDIPEHAMLPGGDNRFSHQMSKVSADDHVHRQTDSKQSRARQKTATHSKESTHYSDHKTDANQIERINVLV